MSALRAEISQIETNQTNNDLKDLIRFERFLAVRRLPKGVLFEQKFHKSEQIEQIKKEI
jgi:hypothetical protein